MILYIGLISSFIYLFIHFINMDLKGINLGYCKGGGIVQYCTNRHDAELMLWRRLSRVE